MTESTPGLSDIVQAPEDAAPFDIWDPANVSPLVAYLATEACPVTGQVFFVQGGKVRTFQPWTLTDDDRPGATAGRSPSSESEMGEARSAAEPPASVPAEPGSYSP